jgi:hypothetical protein
MQYATSYGQSGVGRNYIQAIRKDFHGFPNLLDRKSRPFGENFHQTAGMSWIEMLHEHVCHARIGRKARKKLGKRFKPTCRSAYANDREGHRLFVSVR